MPEREVENDLGQPDCKEENDASDDDDDQPLVCFDCNVAFTSKYYLYSHLLHHIKQPQVTLKRIDEVSELTPIRIKIRGDSFEIISPQLSPQIHQEVVETTQKTSIMLEAAQEYQGPTLEEITNEEAENITAMNFETSYVAESHVDNFVTENNGDDLQSEKTTEYSNIPGAEPTPPPEPSPDLPKIRIKSGLLKDPLIITEITEDNPTGEFTSQSSEYPSLSTNTTTTSSSSYSSNWNSTSNLDDPLRLDNDSSILSNLFSTNNDRAKDLGFTTSDPDFISLDNARPSNSNALAVYSSSTNTMVASNPLDSLTNLPMQQLAQQVSRLQPNSNGGMHQQNVLINIQQFPQAPPPPQPHTYQSHMYPPHPPPQPMYNPYQYQPNNMYYPQAPPAYHPSPHMPPPRPQMPPQMPPNMQQQPQPPQPQQHQHQQPHQHQQQHPQQTQQQQQPQQHPPQQQPMHQNNVTSQYRPPQPRQPQPMGQRQPTGQAIRGGMQPRGMPMQQQRQFAPRQPMAPRQRAPMIRGRGTANMSAIRGVRPRMPMQNGQATPQQQNGPRMIKRMVPDSVQQQLHKRKKMDVLVPDKHDDADCQVISVQPKNTGLPQIQSIQGNAPEPTDNSIMHLSDSITLSVRNPPPKPPSPKKSDAKDVANVLASRGITVTATAKAKEQKSSTSSSPEPAAPVAINLNNSVCIIPTQKNGQNNKEKLTTVDLTEESEPPLLPSPPKSVPPKSQPQNNKVLPFQCDLCPAKYPNSLSLHKHRQSFHKTGTTCDFGIPLIDLRSPGLLQKLATIGIHNYIPLPGASADTTFALPIVNTSTCKNGKLNSIGATSVLTLGPIRNIPKIGQNNSH